MGNPDKPGLKAIKFCNNELFAYVYKLLQIFCTFPLSTSEPERMLSCLNRLKTYLRNTTIKV